MPHQEREGDLHARIRSRCGKTRGGTCPAPGVFVAGGSAGGRGPDESGDRVSAAAAHAGRRRRGRTRQTPGTCRQSAWSGTYLAGRLLPAAPPRDGESGPSLAGGAVRRAGKCDASQSGASGAHQRGLPGGKISQGPGRMGPVVSCCWPPQRNRTCFQRWRRRFLPRRTCPCRVDWHRPPPEPGGSLC